MMATPHMPAEVGGTQEYRMHLLNAFEHTDNASPAKLLIGSH